MRLPSGLLVSTRNLQRLLKTHIKPGMQVLEIGCAPGKTLSWVAKDLQANVAGLDYSKRGIQLSRQLFRILDIDSDLRCEDVFATTFSPGSFDIVYSTGVIEHFEDPREIVRCHVMLLKPGGKALIMVPHYGGLYGRIQRRFDPENLSLHNLNIMNLSALKELSPEDMVSESSAYPAGRMSPWIISFNKKWPQIFAKSTYCFLNLVGLVQPFDIARLCPLLVLELRRNMDPV
jgi:SAM-dependent methyltransferase